MTTRKKISTPSPSPMDIVGPWVDGTDARVKWRDADKDQLHLAVDAVTGLGYALILGRTADGGALSITVLAGDTRPKIYADSAEQLRERLAQLIGWAQDVTFHTQMS